VLVKLIYPRSFKEREITPISRPTRPLPVREPEDKCLLAWVEVLSQIVYGTRAEDGGDLKFALIYLKQRASSLAVKLSLRAGSEPRP
jgi:hypothetical protein